MEKQAEHAPWLGTTGICAWPKPVFPTHDFLNFNALAFAILWGYKTFDFNFVYPKHRLVDPALRAILGIHRELSRRVGSVALFLMCFLNFFSGSDQTVSTAGSGARNEVKSDAITAVLHCGLFFRRHFFPPSGPTLFFPLRRLHKTNTSSVLLLCRCLGSTQFKFSVFWLSALLILWESCRFAFLTTRFDSTSYLGL